jgi:hypothetical protein
MNIADFRNKVIDDSTYETLYGYGDAHGGTKLKLSRALRTLRPTHTILDFSHNFLTDLEPFLLSDNQYLGTCKLLNLKRNRLDGCGLNWQYIVRIAGRLPPDGYICIVDNPIAGGESLHERTALARTEPELFKKIIYLDDEVENAEVIETHRRFYKLYRSIL